MSDILPPSDLAALLAIPDDERRLEAVLSATREAAEVDAPWLRELATHAVRLAEQLHHRASMPAALSLLATAEYRATEYELARSHARDALQAARIDPADTPGRMEEALHALAPPLQQAMADAATTLAISDFRLGDFPSSLLHANLEATLRRALGDTVGEAQARHGLGWGYDKVGLYEQALEHHTYALAVLEPMAARLTASPLNGIAETYLSLGYLDRAIDYAQRALDVVGEHPGHDRERSTALRILGLTLQRKRDYPAAEEFFRRGIEVSTPYGVSLNRLSLADMLLDLGRHDSALIEYQTCLNELAPDAQRRIQCQALVGIGEAELAGARPAAALVALRDALTLAGELRTSVELYRAHHGLARALRALGDLEAALEHYEAYHRHRERVLREASDVRTEVLMRQFDVERRRMDREIERLTNVELAQAYRELRELHRRLELQAAELERLSHLDGLTGLHNRRSLDARLATELARARRSSQPLSLLMIDIDDFKDVNDRFSHTIGDEVLKRLAGLLRGHLRDVDLCARFGGEEFVVVSPDTGLAGATELAEKLRRVVENDTWQGVHPELRLTVSVGAAALRPGEDAGSLLARADAMLYRAKRAGKNCVEG